MITRHLLAGSFLLALWLPAIAIASPTTQPTQSTKLEAQVVDHNGNALSSAHIRLFPLQQEQQAQHAKPNTKGMFRLYAKRHGWHMLEVKALGFQTKTIGLSFRGQKTIQLCIHMLQQAPTKPALTSAYVHWNPHREGAFDRLLRVQKRYIWLLKHFRSNHPHGDLKGIHKSDWKALQARLTRLANETKQAPQDLRSYWSFLRHMIKKHEARETTSAHLSWFKQAGLTTTSHVWTTSHFLLLRALWKPKHKPSMDYIRHMASNHPNPGLRGFLWSLLATQLKQQLARHYTRWQASATPAQKKKRAKRLAQAKQRARKWIKQRLPWAHKHNHKQLQQTLSHLQKCASPNQTKGPRPPGFSVPLYPSRKGRRFQNSDLLGHYTLLAFWATWCDTCVDKMPALHNIYQRYKGYGFRIVSLSYDKTWKEVSTFRKGKWAMPWMHTVLTKGFDSKVGTSFGITLIPSQFLIGPDGRIIAQGDKLRGAFFLPTLSRILNRAYHNEMILAPHISRLQKQHQHHQ